MGINIGLQGEPEVQWEKNVPVLTAFSVINENLALVQVNVADSDIDQLAHTDSGI